MPDDAKGPETKTPDARVVSGVGGSGLTRERIILIGIVAALLLVVAISLTTNLTRMSDRWDEANRSATTQQSRLEPIEIVSGERRHRFMVEVMKSEPDRARGLMFRSSMPQDNGMLFDFGQDQMVTMWMKNTYLSLDMVFIFADGRIHRIESRTEPQSERTIASGVPVRAVLELNANVASRLNLKPGDKIVHPMFR
jgi:uncharacterized protein